MADRTTKLTAFFLMCVTCHLGTNGTISLAMCRWRFFLLQLGATGSAESLLHTVLQTQRRAWDIAYGTLRVGTGARPARGHFLGLQFKDGNRT